MHKRKSYSRRLTLGSGILAAALMGIGGANVSAQPHERAPAPVQAGQPDDPQARAADAATDYVGLVGEDDAGGAAGTEDPSSKPDFGPVEQNPSEAVDVPGEAPASEQPDDDPTTDDSTTDLVAPDEAVGDPASELRASVDASTSGTRRVIVSMNLPVNVEAELSQAAVREQRDTIDVSLGALDEILGGTGSKVLTRYDVIPAAVVEVDEAGLDALLADPQVASVTLDQEFGMALDVSTGVVDSDLLNSTGVLGNNWDGAPGGRYEVAILDSGVDNQHNAFTGRIVAQACFSATSWCPNGATSQIGGAAGDNCTYSTQCDHGTHVGGIAAGNSFAGGHEGVAQGAGIVAIQIGHRSCAAPTFCWRYFFSDLDLALQHTLNLRNGGRNIAALNLSLGGDLFFTEAACGASHSTTQNLAANLQAAGVAVVAAAGNDGLSDRTSYPGCLPSSYEVGATDDVDTPAWFTNSAASTNWWAPGVNIDAPVTSGPDAHADKSGTSMATPHVVGAFALLRECIGNGTPAAVADDLTATGVDVTRNGITRRRINVLDAATRNVNNNDFAAAETIPAGGVDDYDWNVCADSEPGEPGPGSIENSVWWNWTPSATGTATISTEDGGGNVTTFDTVLTVFTGDSLGALTAVAHDDDSGTGSRSLVTFPVNAGTTYRIRVDGFGGSNGELNLHVENGPPPTCGGAAATLVGTGLDDVLNGTVGADVIVGIEGNDTIRSKEGNDKVCGGAGNDNLGAGQGHDLVLGGPGADVIDGDTGDDTLVGNAGGGDVDDVGDRIVGGPGNDVLDGWVGDDVLDGASGNDVIGGAAGSDVASFSTSGQGVTASLVTDTATGDGDDDLLDIEHLSGTTFGDSLTGDDGINVLRGGAGNDALDGGSANDDLRGGDGNDRLKGGGGNDRYVGDAGIDRASFYSSPTGVNANLGAGTAAGEGNDTLSETENLLGSSHADLLRGNDAANRIEGGAGDDTIRGYDGPDSLWGQSGADEIAGHSGPDHVKGGDGDDTMLGGDDADAMGGDTGNDTVSGDDGADQVRGGLGNDGLFGNFGDDHLFGEAGTDHLVGGADDDTCDGGPDLDTSSSCQVKISIP